MERVALAPFSAAAVTSAQKAAVDLAAATALRRCVGGGKPDIEHRLVAALPFAALAYAGGNRLDEERASLDVQCVASFQGLGRTAEGGGVKRSCRSSDGIQEGACRRGHDAAQPGAACIRPCKFAGHG
ncbi:hypothetical protein ACVMB3_006505 [Sinorhizobium meliloti]